MVDKDLLKNPKLQFVWVVDNKENKNIFVFIQNDCELRF